MNETPIIYYHSVAPKKNPNWQNNFLTLELKYFEDQIKYFVRKNYDFLFIDEYFELRSGLKKNKKKTVCLQFDDGYLDNWIFVFPILNKYNIKATIWVNPETIDPRNIIRKRYDEKEFDGKEIWGYLSWEELKSMEKSGLIDIQSHTLSHTKYFVSDELNGFHSPFSKRIYPLWNIDKGLKPYYINNKRFNDKLPYGTPLFEEKSSVIAKKVNINPEFNRIIQDQFKDYNWNEYNFSEAFKKVEKIYLHWKKHDKIILTRETAEEYVKRLKEEICKSKKILEQKLNKKISYLCWPHGDNNSISQEIVIQCGYKASTIGRIDKKLVNWEERLEDRMGTGVYRNSRILSLLRMHFNIMHFRKKFPYYQYKKLYLKMRYGI